jgi:RecB family exonuclease
MHQKIWEYVLTTSRTLAWDELQLALAQLALKTFQYPHEEVRYLKQLMQVAHAQGQTLSIVVSDPEMWPLVYDVCHKQGIPCPIPLLQTSIGQLALLTAHRQIAPRTFAETWALAHSEALDAKSWHTPAGQAVAGVLASLPTDLDDVALYHELHQRLRSNFVAPQSLSEHIRVYELTKLPPTQLQDWVVIVGAHHVAVTKEKLSYLSYWLSSGRQVILTWSAQHWGSPYAPMLWLNRLRLMVQADTPNVDVIEQLTQAPWLPQGAAQSIAVTDQLSSASRPAPCPPIEARPRQLPVTAIDLWRRDPYAIYARYILNLRYKPRWDETTPHRDFGIWLHETVARCWADPDFLRVCQHQPEVAVQKLIATGEGGLTTVRDRVRAQVLWMPMLPNLAEWFVTHHQAMPLPDQTHSEIRGKVEFVTPAGLFTLTAQADRIDVYGSTALMIDYKTGTVPTQKSVREGWTAQLPLEAWILEQGGFMDIKRAVRVQALQHWALKGQRETPGEIGEIADNVSDIIASAATGVQTLVAVFDNPHVPYLAQPDPDLVPSSHEYAHLEREQEWLAC